jgi:hypothetical protein
VSCHSDKRLVIHNGIRNISMANSLQAQLLARVPTFIANFPSITKADIARHCGIDEANFSSALNGRRGLSADAVLRLHRMMSLSRREVMAKFSAPARSSKITQFQQLGQKMELDNSGWCPSEGNTGGGVDPYNPNSNDITDTPSADTSGPVWDQDLIDVLREARGYHRKAVRAINDYINKAKANAGITVPSGVSQKFNRRW